MIVTRILSLSARHIELLKRSQCGSINRSLLHALYREHTGSVFQRVELVYQPIALSSPRPADSNEHHAVLSVASAMSNEATGSTHVFSSESHVEKAVDDFR
jgi:hypothetical protein